MKEKLKLSINELDTIAMRLWCHRQQSLSEDYKGEVAQRATGMLIDFYDKLDQLVHSPLPGFEESKEITHLLDEDEEILTATETLYRHHERLFSDAGRQKLALTMKEFKDAIAVLLVVGKR